MSEALFESAQAILAGCDTAMSQRWRDEDRQWRKEDLQWRKQEEHLMESELNFISSQKHWRGQDMEQRVLDNARLMWDRSVEKNRRAVEERAEQLKEVSNISALIAGFALIAFLEFSFDLDEIPNTLVYGFGLTTALTVGLMVNSMVTCSFMHASILKTGRKYVSEADEANFMFRCRHFARNYEMGCRPPVPSRSFELHWDQRCEGEWRWAFYCFAAGIPTFMLNLALAGMIKFHEESRLGVIIAVIVFFAFLIYLRSCILWAPHLLQKGRDIFSETFNFAAVGLPFDWHLIPVALHEQQRTDGQHLPYEHEQRQALNEPLHQQGEIVEQTGSDSEAAAVLEEGQQDQLATRFRIQQNVFQLFGLERIFWRGPDRQQNNNHPGPAPNWLNGLSQWLSSWLENLWKNSNPVSSNSR
eukprot:g2100.t1